jgi:hypothetical protein
MKYRFQFDHDVPLNDQLRSPEIAFSDSKGVTWTWPQCDHIAIDGRNTPRADILALIYLFFAPGRLL